MGGVGANWSNVGDWALTKQQTKRKSMLLVKVCLMAGGALRGLFAKTKNGKKAQLDCNKCPKG